LALVKGMNREDDKLQNIEQTGAVPSLSE
jgi:hypothetical protein